MSDSRLADLSDWVARCLSLDKVELSVVSGDASFRRYFRYTSQSPIQGLSASDTPSSLIAVDAPPPQEAIEPFLNMTQWLADAGMTVPHIYHYSIDDGFMLLADFGDRTLLPELTPESVNDYYGVAIDELVSMQQQFQRAESCLPAYDATLLTNEMALFRDWFLEKHLQLELTGEEQALLDDVFAQLTKRALEQTQVAVHRDYHSRNLMILNEKKLGVIDYQDAVYGPMTYDLVSLLKDCYICWPRQQQLNWLSQFVEKTKHPLAAEKTFDDWIKDFDWMGLQRHIKVAGIFCRLYHRDGKSGYLNDVPLTLSYLMDAAERYSEFRPFCEFMHQRVAPVLALHNWQWRSLP